MLFSDGSAVAYAMSRSFFKRFFEGRTLKEIGGELDISQSRVSKILGRHLERLKERFEDKVV